MLDDRCYQALSFLRLAARFRAASIGSGLASLARTRQAHLHGVSGREDALQVMLDAEAALERLPARWQHILVAVGVEGQSQGQVAAGLRMPLRSLHRVYHEALHALALDLAASQLI